MPTYTGSRPNGTIVPPPNESHGLPLGFLIFGSALSLVGIKAGAATVGFKFSQGKSKLEGREMQMAYLDEKLVLKFYSGVLAKDEINFFARGRRA